LAEAVRNAIVLSSFLCWLGPTTHDYLIIMCASENK
jgi:hypothetical protein